MYKFNPFTQNFDYYASGSTTLLSTVSKTFYVSKVGNDFNNGSMVSPFLTIKKAVDEANLIASPTDNILVYINAGEYYEDQITVNSYVQIASVNQESVIVRPNDINNPLFLLTDYTGLSFMTIIGVTNSDAVVIDNAETICILHKVYIKQSYNAIRIESSITDTYSYCEYVSIDNSSYSAIQVNSTVNYTEASFENTYIYNIEDQPSYADVICNGTNSKVLYHTGSIVNQFSIGNGIGLLSVNGGSYSIRNIQAEGYFKAIVSDVGTNPSIEINGCTFSDNTYNFYIDESSTTGYFTGYSRYEKYYINPLSQFFITGTDAQVITVSKKGGNFTSVKDAIDSITDNSSTKIYTVKVGSGTFVEDTITLKPYVNLVGESITSTIIEVDSPSKDLINAVGNSGIFRLQLTGATDPTKCAIIYNGGTGVFRCNEVRFGANYCFYKQTSNSGAATSIFNGCSADSNSNFTQAFDISSNGATLSTFAFNTFIYTGNGTNFLKVYGTGASLSAANFTVAKTSVSGYGVHVYNGAIISLNAVNLIGFDKAVYNENLGTGITIYTGAFSLRGNTTDIQLDHIGTTGSIFGFFSKNKIFIDPNINISLLFTDVTGAGTISLGSFWIGEKYSEIYDAKPFIQAQTLGLIEGGELSDGGGFTVNVQEGYGYLEDASGASEIYKRFDWNNDSITLAANQDVFIFINSNGLLTSNATRPDTQENIILGRAVTTGVGIKYIEQAKFDADHTGNKLSKTLREVFGTIFSSGALTTSNSSRKISVTSGTYFLGEIEIHLTGKTFTDNFTPIYRNSTPGQWIESTPTDTITNSLYDDGTGTLAAVPGGTPFVKHTLYVTTDGTTENYYLVIGQNTYSTEQDAISSPNPVIPSWFREQTVAISTIVTDANTATTATVTDVRPRPSFAANSGSSVTDHASLSGLSNDDHLQYILVSGSRAFTGNINVGGNSITNVNLVDGVDVSSHMTRHLPNGVDALTTAAPTINLGGSSTNSAGIANSFSRSDHSHAIDIANGSTTGLLTSTDWNTFNNKVSTTRTISTTAPLQGGGDLSTNRTLSITQATNSTDGYLSSTDWNTFNGKQNALGFTPENISNKSTDTNLGTSNTLYPTQNAVKTYVDNTLSNFTLFDNLVTVNSISDLPTATGGTHTLAANTMYWFNADTFTFTNTLTLGNNTHLYGFNKTSTILNYTGSGNFINATNSNFTIRDLEIQAASGTIFNVTNTPSFSNYVEQVNFRNFNSLGLFNGGGVFWKYVLALSGTNGIAFGSTLGSVIMDTVSFRAMSGGAGSYAIKVNTGATGNSFRSYDSIYESATGHYGIWIAGTYTLTSGGILKGNIFNGTGSVANRLNGVNGNTSGWTISYGGNNGIAGLQLVDIEINTTDAILGNSAGTYVDGGSVKGLTLNLSNYDQYATVMEAKISALFTTTSTIQVGVRNHTLTTNVGGLSAAISGTNVLIESDFVAITPANEYTGYYVKTSNGAGTTRKSLKLTLKIY